MDDQGCPRCKTTKYRNPSLKLMVNVCGHTLCESCVDLLFVRGAGNCHECDTPLRKSNFRVQLFEDPAVDKEVEIRKKVLKIYNKREDDFPSLTEYNDFLEEIEEIDFQVSFGRVEAETKRDILSKLTSCDPGTVLIVFPNVSVFNLTNNVDLENTKRKMELYQKDNKEVIQKNKIKLTREQEELEEALEVERQENEQRRLLIQKEEQLQQMIKRKNKQALLDDLESSNLPASLLLAQHKDRPTQLEMQLEKPKPVKPVTFSTGIKMCYVTTLVHLRSISLASGLDMKEWAALGQQRSIHPKGLDAKKNRFDLSARIYTAVKRTTAFVEVIVKVREPERSAEWEQPGTMGQHISLAPIQKLEEALYEYQPLQVETYGPQVPELEMLGRLGLDSTNAYTCSEKRANPVERGDPMSWLLPVCVQASLLSYHKKVGYLNHVRAASPQDLAGGYTSSLACHRALQDAFSGLFWHPS
ncbi:Mnat1 [Columba guinea]|nr:Mnat1 [Columba guinea]